MFNARQSRVYTRERNCRLPAIIISCLILLLLLHSPCRSEKVIRFYAHSYTPGLIATDNQKSLHQLSNVSREWEKLHPGVRIEFISIPQGEYRTWMLTQLKGGLAPDIMWSHAAWVNDDAVANNWFVSLDKYLDRPNKYVPGNRHWGDSFYKDYLDVERCTDSSLYVLPIDLVECGFFYNKELFKKIGVKPPKSWGELIAVSRKLRDAGCTPVLFPGNGNLGYSWLTTTLADQLWREQVPKMKVKTSVVYVDTQETVRAYKKGIWSVRDPRTREMFRLMKEWSSYWNKDYLTNPDQRLFLTGKAGMTWQGSWNFYTLSLSRSRKFEFGVFDFPRLTEESTSYATGAPVRSLGGPFATQYAISATAVKNGTVDLCVDFLMYLTSPRNMGAVIHEYGCFLPNSPMVEREPKLGSFMSTLANGPALFRGPVSLEMDKRFVDDYYRILAEYLGDQITIDELTNRLDGMVQSAVTRLIRTNPQWAFDKHWDILPDKRVDRVAMQYVAPPFVKYIPWMLVGMFLTVLTGCVVINRREIWHGLRKKKMIYLFVLPTFLLLALFSYYPVFSAMYHSLFQWTGAGQTNWLGFANFRELFQDRLLGESTLNMLKLLAFGILVSLTMPLAAAEAIFHLKTSRAQYIYRVLFVIPMVVPAVVMLLIWGVIYAYDLGVINQLLRSVGLGHLAQAWLDDPRFALYSLMLMGFPWIGGFSLLIYYAGLQSIPVDVLDACKIDGATGIRRFLSVDLPLLLGQVKLLVVLGFIGGVQGFQTQLLLTNGGPGYATMVPGLHMYQEAMYYDRMGYACAIGVVLFAVILALTYINMKYLKSSMEHEAK